MLDTVLSLLNELLAESLETPSVKQCHQLKKIIAKKSENL